MKKSNLQENIFIKAPFETVWNLWTKNYLSPKLELGKKRFIDETRKGIKFAVIDYKENEKLTVIWYSFLVKMVFFHSIEKWPEGCNLICSVKFKGPLAVFIKPLLSGKMKKYIKDTLVQFSKIFN